MKIICPNLKNEEVAREFEELKNATSEAAAYHIWSQNNGNGIDKAPNGEPSKLFSDLLAHYNGDRVAAIQAKARTYSKSFKEWFGDWQSEDKANVSKVVDENGEPLVVYHGTRTSDNINKYGFQSAYSGLGNRGASEGNFYFTNSKINAEYTGVKSQEFEPLIDIVSSVYDLFGTNDVPRVKEIYKLINSKEKELKQLKETIKKLPKISFFKNVIDSVIKFFNKSYKTTKQIQDGYEKLSEDLDKELKSLYDKVKISDFYHTGIKYLSGDRSSSVVNTLHFIDLAINPNSEFRQDAADKVLNASYGTNNLTYSPYVFPVFLNIKDPFVTDYNYKDTDPNPLMFGKFSSDSLDYNNKEQEMLLELSKDAYDGAVSKNKFDILFSDVYIAKNPNQIKSIDNQGTFSTQDNNIYNQQAQTQTNTGRNQALTSLLQKLYPEIEIGDLNDPTLRGQAQVEGYRAGRVLLNAALENQDTLPHEYAHHYIAWFRNAPIVQKAIKSFKGEENLVQAIGENSVKATKWYNKFFNWVKGLFNKNQKVLNELTNSFLSGKELEDPYELLDTEYHYQTVEKDDAPEQILKVYEGLKRDIQIRIKDLLHYKVLDNKKIDELNNQFTNLERMEADEGIFEYINYIEPDIEQAKKRIEAMEARVKRAKMANTPIDLDVEQLVDLKKGFLGFYNAAITNILNTLDDFSVEKYINDPELLKRLKRRMEAIKSDYATIDRKYRLIAADVAKQLIVSYATEKGSTTVEDLKKRITTTDTDLSWFEMYLGSPVYARDEIIRIVADKLQNGKLEVSRITTEKGREIVDKWKKVKKSDLKYLREVNKKGETTGFFTRDLNFGQKYQDFQAFKVKLAEEFGLNDTKTSPTDRTELRKYRRKINQWKAKHVERRFIPEYYELFDNLSDEAVAARDKYQEEINYLLSKVRDKDGNVNKEDMTDEDYDRYLAAKKAKQNLSNLYHEDGTIKEGIEKEIALELKELNDKLSKNIIYKANKEKFLDSINRAKKKGKEKFDKWLDRNTVVKVDEQFYEDLDKVTNSYEKSAKTITLEQQRRELLRLFRDESGNINANNIPESTREQITELDKQIAESKGQDKASQGTAAGGGFSSMAYTWVNPEYYAEWERAAARGQEYFDKWKEINTYDIGYGIQPASFWTRIMPIDKKYLTRYPNREWFEIDRDSYFYNKNFDDSYGENEIPKRSLYDNTAAYNKIIKNKNLKELYYILIETQEEANNENLKFLQHSNAYRLPPIEGGFYRLAVSQDNILKGLGYAATDIVTIKDDDTEYLRDVARRSDGSIVNLVPTRYLKPLENPAAITRDTVGSVIKYYEMSVNYKVMSELAPELELIQQQVGERTYEDKTKGTQLGASTRTYQRLSKMLDMNLWGKQKNLITVKIGGREVALNKIFDALISYTRILGISQNLNVILTGLFTNIFQNRLEAISGYYFDTADLAKATKEMVMSYPSIIKSIGTPDARNKIVAFMEFSQVGRSTRETFSEMNRSRVMRTLVKHYWYFGHEMVDYITKGKMVIATFMAYKYNPDTNSFVRKNEFLRSFKGNKKQAKLAWNRLTTTLYDAYDLKNGLLELKDQFKDVVSPTLENQVKNTARTIATRIDGQLSDIDKALIHASTFGQFLTIFRNFLIVNWQTRFSTAPQYNYATGRYLRSYNRAALDYLTDNTKLGNMLDRMGYGKKYIEQLHQMSYGYDNMKDFEKAAFKRVVSEMILAFFVLGLFTMVMNNMADDDKDNWFLNEIAYLAGRAKLETRGNVSPTEWLSLLNSPTAATNTLNSMFDLFSVFYNEPFANINKGPYKGMKRYQRSLIKLTPLKFYYELKDPRSKREYLEHQLLN